jgi:hypothetical protein
MSLPPRERKVISMYYFGEVTMKEIGAEIGVNESRVSQLHARAIQRLRKALGGDPVVDTTAATKDTRPIVALGAVLGSMKMAKAHLPRAQAADAPGHRAVVLSYKRPKQPPVQPAPLTPECPARRAAVR